MKIHEYQAKAILRKYGVTVPRGSMATSREEAESIAKDLLSSGSSGAVVKAQIHAGGRGKGGGVKIAKSVDEAADLAGKMLGMKLVTHQTGPEGRIVRRLLIEETLPIEKELYLGILVDRAEGKPVFMASAAGGMEIEEVAAKNPEAILKQHIDPGMGLEAFRDKFTHELSTGSRRIVDLAGCLQYRALILFVELLESRVERALKGVEGRPELVRDHDGQLLDQRRRVPGDCRP